MTILCSHLDKTCNEMKNLICISQIPFFYKQLRTYMMNMDLIEFVIEEISGNVYLGV